MKRKTYIVSLVLLIIIFLIGILRILIKKDTDQIKRDRLLFYSEDLSNQKNTALNIFEKYSKLIVEEVKCNPELLNQLGNLNLDNESSDDNLFRSISQLSGPCMHLLEKSGFSYFAFSFYTSKNKPYRILLNDFKTKVEPFDNPDKFNLRPENHSFSTLFYDEKTLKYKLTNQISILGKLPVVFLETGFNLSLIKESIIKNRSDSFIGFACFRNSSTVIGPIFSEIEFFQPDKNTQLFFDNYLGQEIKKYFTSKNYKEITSNLISSDNKGTHNSVSVYLSSKQSPKVISFSHLDLNNSEGDYYLVSVTNDLILDKVNDYNNQIFIINLTIIILIMMGITYLFINRISLLRQKQYIEESELKLKVMNDSKDKFFSIIAHDLKNPFNGIMGMTGYLNESYDQITDKERKEIINDLNISSKNAFNLLQNLLEWTRTQSGTIENIPVKINPDNIIEIALETVENLAKTKDISIKQSYNTNKFGYADENLVATILRNLLTNAVKFSSRKSTIDIIVKDYGNELVFCVKDTGIGLSHDEIDQLFQIDKNFHKKGTESETGTGLGLKICKEFVGYCKGRIWVVSEPDSGSCFYFTIPIYSI